MFPIAGRSRRPASVFACAACALGMHFVVAGSVAAEPVAIIAAVKGRVDVATPRRGPPRRATFGQSLERGDGITVAPGGSATLFFNDGNVVELSERSSLRIGGLAGGSAGRTSGLPRDVFIPVSKFVTGGSRETGLVAQSTLRSGPHDAHRPLITAPRQTTIMTDRPTISWRAVPGATRFLVTVSSPDSGELWRREVEALSLDFPAEVPGLTPSTEYLLDIEAFADGRSLSRESTVFDVLSESQTRTIRANLARIHESTSGLGQPAAHFLAGSYLSGLGLFLDAVDQFDAWRVLMPSSPDPYDALGTVYTRIGLPDLAAAAFKQGRTLAREP